MNKYQSKTVLFVCTGNYYRSRFAEVLFQSVAVRLGLAWRACSRGLALERGLHNIGPIAPATLEALTVRGIHAPAETSRMPLPATLDDFTSAQWIVALKESEHQPLFAERFPSVLELVEFWDIDDAPGVLDLIEQEVMDLAARLISGRKREEKPVVAVQPPKATGPERGEPKNRPVVKIGRETKGRGGKGVTLIYDVPLQGEALAQLAATLKQRCGTGGTVKEGHIEIQGDQRDRLTIELEKLGYQVKRAGG